MAFLSSFKKGKASSAAKSPDADGFTPDPRKAAKFFKHAAATADSRQYDYAIDCYINGLRFEPDNLARHEELREVAKRRKVNGGKSATLKEKLKKPGRNLMEKMLHSEMIWSKDPLNLATTLRLLEFAVETNQKYPEISLEEFAYWVGEFALEQCQNTKKSDKAQILKICDLYTKIGAFDKAIEACRLALALDPQNDDMLRLFKDLEAEQSISDGVYSGKAGGFRDAIKDADLQQDLENQDAITRTKFVVDSNIERRRQDYEEDPEDLDRLAKLVNALLEKKDTASQTESIELLQQAWENTSQYKYKLRIGDIRMSQMREKLKAAKEKLKDNPTEEGKEKFEQLNAEKDNFELEEYQDRSKNYPTDPRIRYELGVRYFNTNQVDDAIGEFQQSRADPKYRASSYAYLARCYVELEFFDESIEALQQGIEAHSDEDDRLGMEMRYLLMDALEQSAIQSRSVETAQESQKIASQLLQSDIRYRDIRDRMKNIKQLVSELQKGD